MEPKAPFLSYDDLRKTAREFLGRYHPARYSPVPIEQIVEFDFGIDIIPMPGLHHAYDVDSFISRDLTEIRVDDFVYQSRRTRYRFSLAHELSHRLLHAQVFQEFNYSSVGDWKQVLVAIPEADYRRLEWQANSLAGLMLVSPDELKAEYRRVAAMVEQVGLSPEDPASLDYMETGIAETFDVSTAVVHRRIEYDGLIGSE